MKIKNVAIKNFRGYSDEINSDFEDLTAFVGKNDIGKSTILEALDIWSAARWQHSLFQDRESVSYSKNQHHRISAKEL